MRAYQTDQVADAFWTAAGGRDQFGWPADIQRAALRALPLGIIRVANLDTNYVTRFPSESLRRGVEQSSPLARTAQSQVPAES